MQRIQHTTAAESKPDYTSTGTKGWFREGAAGGDSPTYVTADWLNLVHGEIESVIDAAGIELDEQDDTQLLQAIQTLIDARLAALAIFPVGAIMLRAVNGATAGWLMCDGAEYSRTAYAPLFAAIGTTFGAGNGTTTFNVPDLRNVFPRCHDARTGRVFGTVEDESVKLPALSVTIATGGAYTANVTSADATLTHAAATVGTAGAVEAQTLTAQATAHSHSFGIPSGGYHTHAVNYEFVQVANGSGTQVIRNIGNYNQTANTDQNNPSTPGNHYHSGTTSAENAHTHLISVPEIPAHTHVVTVPAHAAHAHAVSVSIPSHTHTGSVTGSGGSETRPKNVTLAFMIRAI
jgi:microcystin-dependent protein